MGKKFSKPNQSNFEFDDKDILIQKLNHLDSLLNKITTNNIHTEKNTGKSVGEEIW